jgi:hypothetical protein
LTPPAIRIILIYSDPPPMQDGLPPAARMG